MEKGVNPKNDKQNGETRRAPFAELHEDRSLVQIFLTFRLIRRAISADARLRAARPHATAKDKADAARLELYDSHLIEWSVMGLVGVLSAISALVAAPEAEVLGRMARDWSSTVFGFATSILGFILAGFTIFASVIGADLVVPFVRIPFMEGWKYSTLQVYTYAFLDVVIRYAAFVALHLLGLVILWPAGPVYVVLASLHPALPRIGAYACLVVLAGLTTHLLVVLQSFVFNIFRFVVTVARSRAIKAVLEDSQKDGGS